MEVEGDKGLRGNRERGEESALSRFYFFSDCDTMYRYIDLMYRYMKGKLFKFWVMYRYLKRMYRYMGKKIFAVTAIFLMYRYLGKMYRYMVGFLMGCTDT